MQWYTPRPQLKREYNCSNLKGNTRIWFRVNHRPVVAGWQNYRGSSCYCHSPRLIYTLDIDIHTVFSIITIFIYYFTFTPGSISDQDHFPDLRAELPQESIVSHPISEQYVTPCLCLLTHSNLSRVRFGYLVSRPVVPGLPFQKALAEFPFIDPFLARGRRHLLPHDAGQPF